MNNDVYNNKKGSSLEEAYAKLREAQAQRNASVNQQQYDMTNGVALNTTPLAYNRVQSLSQENLTQTQEQSDDANWAVRLAGTITQGLRNVGKGFLKLGEGVVDAHLAVGGLFNKEWAENVVKFDVTNAIMEWEAENASINALYKKKTGRNLFDESYLNDANEKVQNIAQGVEQGIGNALGFMALSAIPYAGVGLTIMGAGGTSLEENFNDPNYNGDFYGAWGSAAISGGIEAGLERVLGWSPKKSGVSLKTFKSVMKEVGKNFVEEGFEEVASDVINPFFEGMYTDKTLRESYDDVTFESLAETFIVGGITGSIMTGAGEISSTLYLSPEGKKIANKIQYNQELYNDAYANFKNNPNEQEAYDEFIKTRDKVSENMKSLGEQVAKLSQKYQNRIGNVVRINGEKVSLKDVLNNTSNDIKNDNPIVKAVAETMEIVRESGIEGWDNMQVEFVTEGTDAYKEAFGDKIGNGVIKGNKIYLSTNSVASRKFVLGHELLHALKQSSNKDVYEGVRQEIMDSLEKDGTYKEKFNATKETYTDKETGEVPTFDDVEEEMVADYFGENIKTFNELNKLFETQTSWEKFVDKIKNLRKDKSNKKVRDLYQRLIESSRNVKVDETTRKQGATIIDGGITKYNLAAYYNGGRDLLEQELKSNNFNSKDRKEALKIMDDMASFVEELHTNPLYEDLLDWNQTKIIYDEKTGKSIFSSMVKNGEYPLNIDLSTICRKREEMTNVINYLAQNKLLDFANLSIDNIIKINQILESHKFEVACPACFVETKRARTQGWAKEFVDSWNEVLRYVAKDDRKIDNLDFVDGKRTASTEIDETKLNEYIKYRKNDAMAKIARVIKNNPQLRGELTVNDLMGTIGMDAMKTYQPNLYRMVVAKSGSATPKPIQRPSPYDNSLAYITDLKKKAKDVGGVRMFSFSDFTIIQLYDYIQVVGDLMANKATMQTYTKVIAFAKLFGMTGIKVNLSLIPDVDISLGKENAGLDKDGNLIFSKNYSVVYEEAQQLMDDPRYNGNVGTATIGVSDKHIMKLLDNHHTNYIIPYHRSGINPVLAEAMHIKLYKDYTLEQNTRKKVKDENGNESLRKISAKEAKGFNFFKELERVKDARKMADNYKEWCKKNGFVPKFDKFSDHKNYYKLLVDFQVYRNVGKEEVYAPQQEVQLNFPKEFNDIVKEELNRQVGIKKTHNQEFDKAMKEILDVVMPSKKLSLQVPASQQVNYQLSTESTSNIDNEVELDFIELIGLSRDDALKKLRNANITFTANTSKVLNAMKSLARQTYKDKTGFKNEVIKLTRQWLESIKVDGKELYEVFELEKGSKDLNKIITDIVNVLTKDYVDNTEDTIDGRKKTIETMLSTTINNLGKQLKTKDKVRNAVVKIAQIKFWAKKEIDLNRDYSSDKLEGYFKASAEIIKNLSLSANSQTSGENYRNAIKELRKFYNLDVVKQFKSTDATKLELIDEILAYFDKAGDSLKPLDEKTPILPSEETALIEGKTELEIFAQLLSEMRTIINRSKGVTYAELDGQRVIAKDVAKEEIAKQKQANRNTRLANSFFTKGASAYLTSLVDIKAYMTIMSHGDTNSLMMKLYNQLFEGQKETYRVHQDLMSGLRELLSSKEGKKLGKSLKKKTLKFKNVEMTYGEAISLYMMMKTDNAYTHLVGKGIELETNKLATERFITGKKFLSFETEANLQEREMIQSILDVDRVGGEEYTQEQLDYLSTLGGNPNKSNPALRERLTELNREAIEEARKALKEEIGSEYDELISTLEEMYTKSGKYYVDASEKMLGMSFTPKKYYYPTKSARTELSEVDALASFVHTTLNPSFTKGTKQGAKNALYVGDVIDTALGFAKTLSTYAGVTVEVKNVQKFLKAKIVDADGRDMSLSKYLTNYVDNRFINRIDGLFKAMQGIEVGKQSDIGKALKWIRSMAAKSALGANIKTIITQFSSYPKAFMFLSAKSVTKGIFSREKGRFNDGLVDFKWAREHSPFINNRYVDNNVYNIESIGALSKVDTLTDLAMKPIELTDMATLARIWYACQYEVMENGVIDHDKALKLFEQVTADTQAQYDALGNGSVTRTGNEVMNSFLMYSAENRKTLSRIVESIYLVAVSPKGSDARKKASRYLAKTTASVMTQALAVTLIASLLRGLKGDYDDKEKEEIIKEILIDEFSMNFVGMLPIMKDIYNYLINGYDIQISGVSQMTEFLDVFSKYIPTLLNVESTDADRKTAWIQLLTKIGHFFGVPVRNLYNGLMYLGGTADLFFDTNIALQMKNLYYNTNNTGLNTYLKTYAKRGNMDGASKVIQLKFNKYISGNIDDASAKEMARLYSVGALTSFPTQLTTSMTFEGEEVTLTKAQISHAKEVYALANDILPQMLKSSTYRALSDEEKALAIKKLFDTYHDLAKQEVFEGYEGSRLSRVADYVNVSRFASALAKINNIEQTKTQSRKMLVQRYINSLSMKASEKYLLLYLAGYSLNDEKQNVVKSYLRQNGMTYRDAKEYFA